MRERSRFEIGVNGSRLAFALLLGGTLSACVAYDEVEPIGNSDSTDTGSTKNGDASTTEDGESDTQSEDPDTGDELGCARLCPDGPTVEAPEGDVDAAGLRRLEGVHCIDGDLRIRDEALEHLDQLSELRHVCGRLRIAWMDELADVTGLQNLRSAEEVRVSGCEALTSFDAFAEDARIGSISLAGNALARMPGLRRVAELDHFELRSTRVTHLDDLTHLGHMSGSLILEHNPLLESVEGLRNLRSLERLVITQTEALEVIDLSGIESLGVLELTENAALESVEGLEQLDTLSALFLRDNPALPGVHSLSGLRRISNKLVLHGEAVASLEWLAGVEEVGSLDLWRVPYTDLSPLSTLTRVSALRIAGSESMVRLGIPARPVRLSYLELEDLPLLESLEEFSELVEVEGRTVFSELGPGIADLSALHSLEHASELVVRRLDGVDTLTGLENLASATIVWIGENESLRDVSSLGVQDVESFVVFERNPALFQLELPRLRSSWGLRVMGNRVLTRIAVPDLERLMELVITLNRSLPAEDARAVAEGLEIPGAVKVDGNLGDPVHVDICPWEGDGVCDVDGDDPEFSLCPPGTDEVDCEDPERG